MQPSAGPLGQREAVAIVPQKGRREAMHPKGIWTDVDISSESTALKNQNVTPRRRATDRRRTKILYALAGLLFVLSLSSTMLTAAAGQRVTPILLALVTMAALWITMDLGGEIKALQGRPVRPPKDDRTPTDLVR